MLPLKAIAIALQQWMDIHWKNSTFPVLWWPNTSPKQSRLRWQIFAQTFLHLKNENFQAHCSNAGGMAHFCYLDSDGNTVKAVDNKSPAYFFSFCVNTFSGTGWNLKRGGMVGKESRKMWRPILPHNCFFRHK